MWRKGTVHSREGDMGSFDWPGLFGSYNLEWEGQWTFSTQKRDFYRTPFYVVFKGSVRVQKKIIQASIISHVWSLLTMVDSKKMWLTKSKHEITCLHDVSMS